MSNHRLPPRVGRWARWTAVLGLALALGLSSMPRQAEADTRARRASKPAADTRAKRAKKPPTARAHGRAEPVGARRRGRLAPPAVEKVAIGTGLADRDETPAAARTRAAAAATAIDKLLRGPLRHGTTALHVVDADSGRELFSLRPDERLNPASNVKLISTAAALELLGPDYRYPTRVLGPAPDATGTVAGDLYLHGSYDPTLGTAGLEDLATQLAAAGVRRVDGDVLVGSVPTRDGLYRSRIRVDVAAGAPGAPPTVAIHPAYDFVEVVNQAQSGKRAKVKGRLRFSTTVVTHDDGRRRLVVTVKGPIGKGKRVSHVVSTKERHLHAAHLLRAALRRHGVELTGDVAIRELPAYVDGLAAGGRLPVALAEHRSAPLADIVAQVNKRSINWLSDRVIATAALTGDDDLPSMPDAVDAMYGWLERRAGIRRNEAVVDTGSGLSYRTQLSARQIVKVLRTAGGMSGAPDDPRLAAAAAAFTRSLSIGGVDGTLRGRFRADGLRGRVAAKTGTLSNVIALSGVLTGPDGRRLVFSLVTNGHDRSRKRTIRTGHEQVLQVLDRFLADTAALAPAPAATPVEPAGPVTTPEPLVAGGGPADEPVTDPSVVDEGDDAEEGSSPDDDLAR